MVHRKRKGQVGKWLEDLGAELWMKGFVDG